MIRCTFHIKCDRCGAAREESYEIPHGALLPEPRSRWGLLRMDLCEKCEAFVERTVRKAVKAFKAKNK